MTVPGMCSSAEGRPSSSRGQLQSSSLHLILITSTAVSNRIPYHQVRFEKVEIFTAWKKQNHLLFSYQNNQPIYKKICISLSSLIPVKEENLLKIHLDYSSPDLSLEFPVFILAKQLLQAGRGFGVRFTDQPSLELWSKHASQWNDFHRNQGWTLQHCIFY